MLIPGTLRAWKQREEEDDRKAVSEADRCLGATSCEEVGGVMVPAGWAVVGVGVESCRETAIVVAAEEDDDDPSADNAEGCGDADEDAASNDVLGVLAAAGAWPSGSVGVRGAASD